MTDKSQNIKIIITRFFRKVTLVFKSNDDAWPNIIWAKVTQCARTLPWIATPKQTQFQVMHKSATDRRENGEQPSEHRKSMNKTSLSQQWTIFAFIDFPCSLSCVRLFLWGPIIFYFFSTPKQAFGSPKGIIRTCLMISHILSQRCTHSVYN